MSDKLSLDKQEIQNFLDTVYKTRVKVMEIKELSGSDESIKGLGYGDPVLIEVEVKGLHDRLVLHTVREDKFGHERRSDRAQAILLDYDIFNRLPKHVEALSVGAFTPTGKIKSLQDAGEFSSSQNIIRAGCLPKT